MELILQSYQEYIHRVLGFIPQIGLWEAKNIPFFLHDLYFFHTIKILEKTYILMVPREEVEVTPGLISKHIEQLEKESKFIFIYLSTTISHYNRKRLIDRRIPFVIPENQMFLPDLGIDLREYFLSQKKKSKKKFLSPSAQAVIIFALNHWIKNKIFPIINPSKLAKILGYSLMTMTRVLNELELHNVGYVERRGKERWLNFKGNGRELWEKVLPLLKSPIKKHIWLKNELPREMNKALAGTSALSHYSMLSDSSFSVYAVGFDKLVTLLKTEAIELIDSEEATINLEVWTYDPCLFSQEGICDPFSLYLSLRENKNERVEAALEEMMEKIKW